MVLTIYFYNKFLFQTNKINNIVIYNLLSSETIPQLLISYVFP